MNETKTYTEFNINKVKVVKELLALGYKVTNTCEVFETNNLSKELKDKFEGVAGFVLGSWQDLDNGYEGIFGVETNFEKSGIILGMRKQYLDYYYVELQNENKIAYVIVQVKNGLFIRGHNGYDKKNEHKIVQLGFDNKEYHNDWNEFRNEYTLQEFNEWKKFTKSWREIIS